MAINLNNTTPAAPAGNQNVTWQQDGSGNVSAYVPNSAQEITGSSVDLTGQTANVGATTILTPSANQMYRISSFSQVTTVDGASSTLPKTTISWTDFDSNHAQTFDITPTNSGNLLTTFQQNTMILKAKSAVAIQYTTSGYASGTPATMQYALHIRIEAI